MRFNLNKHSSVLFGYQGAKQAREVSDQARFYAEACLAFCDEHDLQYHSDTHTHLNSPAGAEDMASWLSSKGWRVSAWRINWELADPLAWGLNFEDTCPRFTEARLRGWRYIE